MNGYKPGQWLIGKFLSKLLGWLNFSPMSGKCRTGSSDMFTIKYCKSQNQLMIANMVVLRSKTHRWDLAFRNNGLQRLHYHIYAARCIIHSADSHVSRRLLPTDITLSFIFTSGCLAHAYPAISPTVSVQGRDFIVLSNLLSSHSAQIMQIC